MGIVRHPRERNIAALYVATLAAAVMIVGACGSSATSTTPSGVKDYTDTKALEAAAKKEGSVTVYLPNAWPALIPAFKAAYPWAQVSTLELNTAQIYPKFTTELQGGVNVADAMFATFEQPAAYDKLRALAHYKVENDSKVFSTFQDPAYLYHPLYQTPIVLGYNTKLVSTPPTSLLDLGQPVWSGKIVMNNPTSQGVGVQLLASMRKPYGEAKWTQWLAGIKANKPLLTNDAGSAYQAVVSGERALCVCTFSDIYSQKPGTPVAAVYQSEGVLENLLSIVVPDKAPHPQMGALFVNWMLSPTGGQKVLADSGRIPVVTIAGAPALPAGVKVLSIFNADADYIANPTEFLTIMKSYFS